MAGVGPGLAEGTVGLAAALLVVGVTSGAMDVAINAEGSRAEILTGRPLLNLSHAWFSIGVIIGSLGAGLLRSTGAGLVTVLVVVGAVVAGMGACLGTGEVDGDGSTEQPPARVTPGPWWRPPRYLAVLGVLLGLAFLAENAWQTWAAVHLERDLGASEGRARSVRPSSAPRPRRDASWPTGGRVSVSATWPWPAPWSPPAARSWAPPRPVPRWS